MVLPNKFTPLTWSIWKGYEELFNEILKQKDVRINRKDGWNKTPGATAMAHNRPAMMNKMMGRKTYHMEDSNALFKTKLRNALSVTIKGNNKNAFYEIIYEMKELSMDLNTLNEIGETPLITSIKWRRYELAKWLLEESEVDCRKPGSDGLAPLQLALCSNMSILKLLLQKEGSNSSNMSDTDLQFMIENMSDLDVNMDINNYSPLTYSVVKGHEEGKML